MHSSPNVVKKKKDLQVSPRHYCYTALKISNIIAKNVITKKKKPPAGGSVLMAAERNKKIYTVADAASQMMLFYIRELEHGLYFFAFD